MRSILLHIHISKKLIFFLYPPSQATRPLGAVSKDEIYDLGIDATVQGISVLIVLILQFLGY